MAESDLQRWMQWRLLQPIATSLTDGDLQRWGQWWQEPDGQTFWQSCEWLWLICGPRAISAVPLHIEAALPDHDPLPRWVQQWQHGDPQACWRVCEWLREHCSAQAARLMYHLLDDDLDRQDRMQKVDDVIDGAFWAALEELDLKVSCGQVLTKPTPKMRKVTLAGGKVVIRKVFLGKVSGREVTERTLLNWHGMKSFQALFKEMWISRCWGEVRRGTPTRPSSDEVYNQLTGELEVVKTRVPIQAIPIELARVEDSQEQDNAYEDALPGQEPDPRTFVLDADAIAKFITALTQVAKQLRCYNKPSLAAVAQALLDYIKQQIAPALAQPGSASLQSLEFNEDEAWDYVQDTLGLSRDARYKRKERFFEAVRALPQVPVILKELGYGKATLR